MSIPPQLPEKSPIQEMRPLQSARATYTQQAETAQASSLSRSSAEGKDCFTTLIDTIKGWINFVWGWLTSWCAGQESSSVNGAGTQTVQTTQGAAPVSNTAAPTESQPRLFNAKEVENRVDQAIFQMIDQITRVYGSELPGDVQYVCIDFQVEAFSSESPVAEKREEYRIRLINDRSACVLLKPIEESAERLTGGVTVTVAKKDPASTGEEKFIFYRLSRRWDAQITQFLHPSDLELIKTHPYTLERINSLSLGLGVAELLQKIAQAPTTASQEVIKIEKLKQAINETALAVVALYKEKNPKAPENRKYCLYVDCGSPKCLPMLVQGGKIIKEVDVKQLDSRVINHDAWALDLDIGIVEGDDSKGYALYHSSVECAFKDGAFTSEKELSFKPNFMDLRFYDAKGGEAYLEWSKKEMQAVAEQASATSTPAASPTSPTPTTSTAGTPQQKINQKIESMILGCVELYEKEHPESRGQEHTVFLDITGKYFGFPMSVCKSVLVQNGKVLKHSEIFLELTSITHDLDEPKVSMFSIQTLILKPVGLVPGRFDVYLAVEKVTYKPMSETVTMTSQSKGQATFFPALEQSSIKFHNESAGEAFLKKLTSQPSQQQGTKT